MLPCMNKGKTWRDHLTAAHEGFNSDLTLAGIPDPCSK